MQLSILMIYCTSLSHSLAKHGVSQDIFANEKPIKVTPTHAIKVTPKWRSKLPQPFFD